MRPLALTALALCLAAAGPARAQFKISQPESPDCAHSPALDDTVEAVNDATGQDFTVASVRDSKGRCTRAYVDAPFQDPLYRPVDPAPLFDEAAGFTKQGALLDETPSQYGRWTVDDHLNLRMGYVVYGGETQTYFFFDRYGHLTYVAGHTARDQWALFDPSGRLLGAVYAADPPRAYRWDERLVTRYKFVYDYPYFN